MRTYNISDLTDLPKNSYGVIGCPVEHSVSPIIHNGLTGEDNYNRILLRPEELSKAMPILKAKLKGINCTIPHKLAIMEYADYIDDTAKMYGAVNTIKIEDNKLYAYNTDGLGFRAALQRAEMSISNRRVLLCGNGGVARVMAFEAVMAYSSLTIYCRNIDKGDELRSRIIDVYPNAGIRVTDSLRDERYDILLNGTPQGMYPDIDKMPISEELLDNIGEVYDTIYNPLETKLLRLARARGLRGINGLYMLVAQAVYARQIWEDISYNNKQIDRIAVIIERLLTAAKEKKI